MFVGHNSGFSYSALSAAKNLDSMEQFSCLCGVSGLPIPAYPVNCRCGRRYTSPLDFTLESIQHRLENRDAVTQSDLFRICNECTYVGGRRPGAGLTCLHRSCAGCGGTAGPEHVRINNVPVSRLLLEKLERGNCPERKWDRVLNGLTG